MMFQVTGGREKVNDPALIRATAMTPYLGAEVHGVDLSQGLGNAAFARILQIFHRHCVIFFRQQNITPEQFAEFSARFGELDVHHMTEHVLPHLPQVRILSNVKKKGREIGITRGGMHWHSDLSYKTVPASATLLYGVECPPEGAETQFVNMYSAYEALPENLKVKIRGKRAVHDRNFRYSELYPNRPPLTQEQLKQVPPVEHPIVRIHPQTRRPALFLSKDIVSRIIGISEGESRRLIDQMESDATSPQFIYSHKWQPGDVLIWDNRCTLHRATPYDNKYQRTLYRTQVKGEVPIPA